MNEDNSLGGMLLEVLHLITGNKILDVGTGFGIVVGKLMERSDTQVFSVDPEAWSFASLHSTYEEQNGQKPKKYYHITLQESET